MELPKARMRVDWFGWSGRRSMPARGPRWFVSRGANFLYLSLGGICSVTLPWWWSRSAIDSRGYERGWNAGYQAGWSSAQRTAATDDHP